MSDNVFSETQYFRQRWLWGLIGIVFLLSVYFPVSEGRYTELAVTVAIFAFLGSLLYFAVRLETRVDDKGIHYRFFPAHLEERTVTFDEIQNFTAGKYSPLREFGGWGMRWRPGRIAFTVSGDRCARFERDGEIDIVIGTRKPEEFREAVRDRL